MKTTDWIRFNWDLNALEAPASTPEKYHLRLAERDEHEAVVRVLNASLSLDSEWSPYARSISEFLDKQLEAAFSKKEKESHVLVLSHGTRIIGASLLDEAAEHEFHVVSGPCVMVEYQRRGFGSLLLHASLHHLKERGLKSAQGVTRRTSMAANYVYPKFGGTGEAFEFAFPEAD